MEVRVLSAARTPAFRAQEIEARIAAAGLLSQIWNYESKEDAVRQWLYKPMTRNGQPVEVVTQIDVNFTLN